MNESEYETNYLRQQLSSFSRAPQSGGTNSTSQSVGGEEKKAPESDSVNHPAHYRQGSIECIDAIKAAVGDAGFKAYCTGNVMKYIWRYQYKNGWEDLKKAHWYLTKLVESYK